MKYGSLPAVNYPRLAGLYRNAKTWRNYLIASAPQLAWRWESLCELLGRRGVAASAVGKAAIVLLPTEPLLCGRRDEGPVHDQADGTFVDHGGEAQDDHDRPSCREEVRR